MEQHIRVLSEQIENIKSIIQPYKLRCWDFYTLEKMNQIQELYKDIHKTIRTTTNVTFPFPQKETIEEYVSNLSQQIENIEGIIQPYRWLWGKDMYTREQMYKIQSFFEEINRMMISAIHIAIVTERDNGYRNLA